MHVLGGGMFFFKENNDWILENLGNISIFDFNKLLTGFPSIHSDSSKNVLLFCFDLIYY